MWHSSIRLTSYAAANVLCGEANSPAAPPAGRRRVVNGCTADSRGVRWTALGARWRLLVRPGPVLSRPVAGRR